jgi:hypothetical protein
LKRFIRNRVILVLLAAWFMYWPAVAVVPTPLFLEFINGMLAAVSFGVAVAYIPDVWQTMRKSPFRLTDAHLLVLGTTLIHLGIALIFAWGWLYRILSAPSWMVDHPLRGWLIYLVFLGAVLHLVVGDVQSKGTLPSRGWVHIGTFVAIGLSTTVILLLAIGRL